MSLLPFAQRHIRTKLLHIAPDVARSISTRSFVLSRQYLGNSLIFLNKDGEPALIYKATRNGSLNHFAENGLKCARKAESHGFNVQPVYDTGRFFDRAYVVLGWVPGTPLEDRWIVPPCDNRPLTRAVEMITRLHRRTMQAGIANFTMLERRVKWWRELLFGLYALPSSVHKAIDNTLSEFLEQMQRLPTVLMHGDYVPVNLIQNVQHDLTLIDWELGLSQGPPVIDVVSFLLNLGFEASDQGRGKALCRCFLDATPDAKKCWCVVNTYAEELRLPVKSLPVFIATTHIKLVAEDLHYRIQHRGPCTDERDVNNLLVLEEFL